MRACADDHWGVRTDAKSVTQLVRKRIFMFVEIMVEFHVSCNLDLACPQTERHQPRSVSIFLHQCEVEIAEDALHKLPDLSVSIERPLG